MLKAGLIAGGRETRHLSILHTIEPWCTEEEEEYETQRSSLRNMMEAL